MLKNFFKIAFRNVLRDRYFTFINVFGLAIGLALQGTLSHVASGLMLVFFRPFRVGEFIEAGGVSGTVLMAECHVCRHTWPDQKGVTLDVYVGNVGGDHSAKARGLMFALVQRFQPEWTEQRSLDRGEEE